MAVALSAPVLLRDVIRDVLHKVQDVVDGLLSPEQAFPPVVKLPPPDPIELDPVPTPARIRAVPKPPSKRRVCATCGKRRRISQFYVNWKARGGYAIHCRTCWQKRVKARREAEPEKHRAWARKAHERYRRTDKQAEVHARYRASHKGVLTERLVAHKRRALREGIEHDLTKADLKMIARTFFGRCAYCGTVPVGDFYMDHVVPVQENGPDVAANLVICCRPCNRRKGKKNIYELMQDAFWDAKKKRRFERVLQHAWSARGWERVKPHLERLERAAGGMGELMASMEPWLRLLVRRGYLTRDEAKTAMETMSDEGLLEFKETFAWTLEQEEKEDRREAMRYA